MRKTVRIDGDDFRVMPDEFQRIIRPEYSYLRMYHGLALLERIIGLCAKLSSGIGTCLVSVSTTHGGLIPIRLTGHFDHIYLIDTEPDHLENIRSNSSNLFSYHLDDRITNAATIWVCMTRLPPPDVMGDAIVISKHAIDGFVSYSFAEDMQVSVSEGLLERFNHLFRYYIRDGNRLVYDNLINMCIMVKDAGSLFERILTENLDLIDRWTILDTGSTDDTIETIKRVLVGKREGQLFTEPFINFRDSRNRLLDLAGTECKFNLMLDDTYIVRGDLRQFLTETRSDQMSSSFQIMIRSDDCVYGSNRITKSRNGLRYIHKIHEIINDKGNTIVLIPQDRAWIEDVRSAQMEKRSLDRKRFDILLLQEELEDDPQNPRTYYYMAQTYAQIGEFDKALHFFLERCKFIDSGFNQERIDSMIEAARICAHRIGKPWDECEPMFLEAYRMDPRRPEGPYFIGAHYFFSGDIMKAYSYLKQAFEIGYPELCQFSLRPTISFHFGPKLLARCCYQADDPKTGEACTAHFLKHNDASSDDYTEMVSWHDIYKQLNIFGRPGRPFCPPKPICCFVADGGYGPWNGNSIKTSGVGGSETHTIEMARRIQKRGVFDVWVFCRTPGDATEVCDDVVYTSIGNFYNFIGTTYTHSCIISRFSEYLPVAIKGYAERVYLFLHDLSPSGCVIPMHPKLKNIFCLTNWHAGYFSSNFPMLKNHTCALYYGVDAGRFSSFSDGSRSKFIYSSMPNRGLVVLLRMWPRIRQISRKATLDIFCDIHHPWCNKVNPDMMDEIRSILARFSHESADSHGVIVHGWVSKERLSLAWREAGVWFYPCIFQETFCLTALEAATSRTLAISTHLAALSETVGDRGVIIDGDPTTDEWQEKALDALCTVFSKGFDWDKLLDKNQEWASGLTWERQGDILHDKYLMADPLEVKGMFNWTHDIPAGSRTIFEGILDRVPRHGARILEIGTFTGISLIGMVERIPLSTGIGLDAWSDYQEEGHTMYIQDLKVMDSFYSNVRTRGLEHRISGLRSDSTDALMRWMRHGRKFDLIYVDGCHRLLDCYADLLLAWEILEGGGHLIIDDYLWNKDRPLESPFEAVNRFMEKKTGCYELIDCGARVCLVKNFLIQ